MKLSASSSAVAAAGLCIPNALAATDEQAVLSKAVEGIPLLGFGTWNVQRSNASDVVESALKTGYRHLDCAAIYGNEKEVGPGITAGLKDAGLKRGDIWVTSKLWNDRHAPEDVPKALEQTLSDLGLEYLDLYLMHWPAAKASDGSVSLDYIETWKAMTKLPTSRVRHVGVSNFSPSQLDALIKATPDHIPYAHQMEMHPYLPQSGFLDWHDKHGIHVTAYSPFGNTNPTYGSTRKQNAASAVPALLDSPLLSKISAKIGCTPAQTALAWGMQRGTSVIPKSSHEVRIQENFRASNCRLADADVKALESELPVKRFNNPSKSWGVPLYDGLEDADAAVTAALHGGIADAVESMKSSGQTWIDQVWRTLTGWESDL